MGGEKDGEWRCDSIHKQLALMVRVAKVINNLLGHSPAQADPMQALPTPTPAVWASIRQTHAKIQETLDWLSDTMVSEGSQDDIESGYQRLHQELIKVSSNLVVGHLPNLGLDVLDIMRYVTQLSCWQLKPIRRISTLTNACQLHWVPWCGCLATESSPYVVCSFYELSLHGCKGFSLHLCLVTAYFVAHALMYCQLIS